VNVLKNPRIAAVITVIAVAISFFFGAYRSIRSEARQVAAMFIRGVDDSGYGISGDLDERVDCANQLLKVAERYDGLDAEIAEVEKAVIAMLSDREPAARFQADLLLQQAVTGLELALNDISLSEKDQKYRDEIMANFESPSYKIKKEAVRYNAMVDSYTNEVLCGAIGRFVNSIVKLPVVEAYR